MAGARRNMVWSFALTLAFAVHVGMTVALTGRLPAAALATAQALGALALAAILAGRPLAALRGLDARSRVLAGAGGLVGIFGPPAVIAGVRMSDAPAGSAVVFWMAGGWAAVAAVAAMATAFRSRTAARTPLAFAGGVLALAGAAGVVANWERPSSFSPLVRFPVEELAILVAGALMVVGALAVLRAARDARIDGALLCAAASAAVAGIAWWGLAGANGWSYLAERPAEMVLAALAWGFVCVALPRVLRSEGPARAGALLAVAPLLLTSLIWLEQLVGVAGPQPMIVTGVLAGGVTLVAGSIALWRAASDGPPVSRQRRIAVIVASSVPLALACAALALPAIIARVEASAAVGSFVGSWTLFGWESVAGVSALALTALLAALAWSENPLWPALAGLAACAVWPLSLSTPMHVLTGWLPPGIEQYYGTEYASISFTRMPAPWMIAAAITCGAGFALIVVSDVWQRLRRTRRQGVPGPRP